jgi:hypothetical protein
LCIEENLLINLAHTVSVFIIITQYDEFMYTKKIIYFMLSISMDGKTRVYKLFIDSGNEMIEWAHTKK